MGTPQGVGTKLEHVFARERTFLEFMRHFPGLAWIKDRDGRYCYVNDAASAAFLPFATEILGRTDDEIFPSSIAAQFKTNDRLAFSSPEGVQVVEQLEHEDGIVHHSLVSKFPLGFGSGEAEFVGGMAIDVTDRKWAEEKLQAMLRSIGDHLVCYDRNWRFTHVNDAVAAALEKSKEELVGHSIWELFPEEVGGEYYRKLHQAAESQRIVRYEHFFAPHGFWLENYIYPSPDGITVFSSNVTWRKQMQQELELRAEELAAADRRKNEFLALLGHELRNPLAPLSNALQVLKHQVDDPEAFERTRGMMERQVSQLGRLIDDLLDVGRITHGQLELRTEDMDLTEAMRSSVEDTMPLISRAGLNLHLECPEEPIWVRGDRSRLCQVFANLLNNAARYSQPGGSIWVSTEQTNGSVVVKIRDDGIGIRPDALDSIFEMFVRLGDSVEPNGSGLGLGLTLVKELVERHGGAVGVCSDGEGEGATFSVRLPVLANPTIDIPSDERTPGTNGKLKVLIVDDNVDSADTMALLLQTLGHETVTAYDGASGLDHVASFSPDLVLLDIGLPFMDGYEVARRIRDSHGGMKVRLAAMTGWGQEEDIRRSGEAGFDVHLTKPVRMEELEKLLGE